MKGEYVIDVKIKRKEKNFYQEIDSYKGDMNTGLHYIISKYGINRLKNKLYVIDKKVGDWLFGK